MRLLPLHRRINPPYATLGLYRERDSRPEGRHAMLAFAFLATAILYGLAVIAWEEARR